MSLYAVAIFTQRIKSIKSTKNSPVEIIFDPIKRNKNKNFASFNVIFVLNLIIKFS